MKLIQFNTNLLKCNKNDMFRAVWNVIFFLTLCFIVAKFCFSSSDYLNEYKHFFFTLTLLFALLIVFFFSEILCCVFKFDWLSD